MRCSAASRRASVSASERVSGESFMADKIPHEEFENACLLVGRFMYHFALLEGAVNSGIKKLLGLKDLEGTIATSNMQFRSKIHILKSVVHLKGGKSEALKDLDAIADFSATRNVIAHNIFGPENGGVRFLTAKAKGKLSFPTTIYSNADFLVLCRTASDLRAKMETITDGLSKPKLGLLGLLAQASLPERDNPPAPLCQMIVILRNPIGKNIAKTLRIKLNQSDGLSLF